MLAQDEVLLLKKEGDNIEINDIDVISWSDYHESSDYRASYGAGTNTMSLATGNEQLGKLIDEKFDRFTTMLENKDHLLEEKNTMIFWLQKKIGEMETKIQAMIALPEHHNEKDQLLTQKKRASKQTRKYAKLTQKRGDEKQYLYRIIGNSMIDYYDVDVLESSFNHYKQYYLMIR